MGKKNNYEQPPKDTWFNIIMAIIAFIGLMAVVYGAVVNGVQYI